ncbi:MAG: hypothetical protein J0I42_13450 [Bosea sp.]|uniref:hypothetical protein n=1 Tax=Bosea sp. (in: a-proteobacteria) TaxID=1871050 RepID=UPI001ACF27B4|nr:hypothetical protein [Bosea sp. (in: a-proteobacteria)]MBN9452948.1 hypothetical protein [Bosea sp. (in: a-proteobacteria)]
MSPDRTKRMRADILTLSRADLRDLAKSVDLTRDDLTDFAELGGDLPLTAQTALTAWYEVFETRKLFHRPHVNGLIASLYEATGVTEFHRQAFVQGETDLTAEQRDAIRRHMIGLPDYIAPAPVTFGSSSASLPPEIGRRADLLRQLRQLPIAALEALVASAQKQPPA